MAMEGAGGNVRDYVLLVHGCTVLTIIIVSSRYVNIILQRLLLFLIKFNLKV